MVLFFVGLLVGAAAGVGAAHYWHTVKSDLATAHALLDAKLQSIEQELKAIDIHADARIKPAIHKVTARVRGLL